MSLFLLVKSSHSAANFGNKLGTKRLHLAEQSPPSACDCQLPPCVFTLRGSYDSVLKAGVRSRYAKYQ